MQEKSNFELNGKGWIGFDLDSTLSVYTGWIGFSRIGDPVPGIVNLMLDYARKGWEVRVFTGRVAPDPGSKDISVKARIHLIRQWLNSYVVPHLPKGYPRIKITYKKDKRLYYMYDDRGCGVLPSEGITANEVIERLVNAVDKDLKKFRGNLKTNFTELVSALGLAKRFLKAVKEPDLPKEMK